MAETVHPDPLFYMAGYGSAGVDLASTVGPLFSEINRTRDIVLFDQRGTGQSNPLQCQSPTPEQQAKMATDDMALSAYIDACVNQLSGDPRFYTTPLATDDLDQIRAALGYAKINLYGVSYGVSSSLAYIQQHGGHVRSAVLDSGSMLDYRLWEMAAPHAQQALDQLFERCAADVSCSEAFPDLTGKFSAVTAKLNRSPVTVNMIDPRSSANGGPITLSFTSLNFAWTVENLDAYTNTAVLLPRLIDGASKGDFAPIARQYLLMGADSLSSQVQAWVLACTDEWAAMNRERVAALAKDSYYGPYTVASAINQARLCGHLPAAAGSSGKVNSDVNVLFLNGTADPADPPENVASAKETLPNSLLVAVPGAGHGTIELGCIRLMAAAFVAKGSAQGLPLYCASNVQLPRFDLGT